MIETLARAGITDLAQLAHLAEMLGMSAAEVMEAAARHSE